MDSDELASLDIIDEHLGHLEKQGSAVKIIMEKPSSHERQPHIGKVGKPENRRKTENPERPGLTGQKVQRKQTGTDRKSDRRSKWQVP